MKSLHLLLYLALLTTAARADYTGVVAEVHTFESGAVALDLDGRYPHQKMIVYLSAKAAQKCAAAGLHVQAGDTVTATGKETIYKGSPEIVVRDPAHLAVIEKK